MLDFIREKLSEKMPGVIHKIDDSVPNETIMECAHLIQELSDLSVEGEDELDAVRGSSLAPERPMASALDIPLEDDLEIGSLELNLLDGRPTDIPGDTSVPTVNEYATNMALKTEEDFYQEACMVVRPFARDNSEALEERRREYAEKLMKEYQEQCIQEGVFGHDKLKITDTSVPATTTVNFGPLKGAGSPDYYVKLPIKYQVDNHQKVLKKQVEAIAVINEIDAFKELKKKIHEIAKGSSSYKLESEAEIWEHATPVELRVPKDPADKYVVFVVIDADWEDNELVFSCTISMKGAGKKVGEIKSATGTGKKAYKSKKEVIKENADILAMEKARNFPTRFGSHSFFQEAIDMGQSSGVSDLPPSSGSSGDDVTVSANSDPAPATDDNNSAATPTVDVNADNTNSAPTDTTGDNAPSDDTSNDGAVEVPVQTNDVSDQIADKVASETQDVSSQDAVNSDIDNINDVATFDENGNDYGFDDNASSDLGTDLDSSLDENNTNDVDLPGDSEGNVDISQFENMSIDDLMQQGSEKLKSLSIGQLKSFLSGENTDPLVSEAFQEAFFLTPRNINRAVYDELKRVLGILNESVESGVQILGRFKRQSSGLNRALVKASKMSNVYNPEERKMCSKLNKCLGDLNVMIGSRNDSSYASTIRRLIEAFISQADAVVKMLESKDPSIKEDNRRSKIPGRIKGTTNVQAMIKKGPKGVINNG